MDETYESDQRVTAYMQETMDKAENLILKEFPVQISELNELIKSNRFNVDEADKIYVETGIPVPFSQNGSNSNKRKRSNSSSNEIEGSGFNVETLKGGTKVLVLPNGSVPTNHHLHAMIEELKPRIRTLMDNASLLRMWIIFLTPKIEDGNNFGVGIQEDALEDLRAVEAEAATYFEHFSRYYLSRAKIVSKIAKYPHVDDFRQTLRELDERQLHALKITVAEMRNHYAAIYNLILKNFEKIKRPRNYNASSMY